MTYRLYRVDAFASKPFSGNPAVVLLLHDRDVWQVPTELLQATAAEFNQPATCFVSPAQSRDWTSNDFSLRWFSPTHELPLCGHGTLASTAALIQEGNIQDTFLFSTKNMDLSVKRLPTNPNHPSAIQITLPQSDSSTVLPKGLTFDTDQLKVITGEISVKEVLYAENVRNAIVVLGDGAGRRELESLQPDLQLMMAKLQTTALNGVIVTCQGDQKPYHFLSRYFAPWIGCGEDAVTGSAHVALGPYWAGRLNMCGKPMQARQCSPRGGDLKVTVSEASDQVSIAGQGIVIGREMVSIPF